jgi:hypothetical protein
MGECQSLDDNSDKYEVYSKDGIRLNSEIYRDGFSIPKVYTYTRQTIFRIQRIADSQKTLISMLYLIYPFVWIGEFPSDIRVGDVIDLTCIIKRKCELAYILQLIHHQCDHTKLLGNVVKTKYTSELCTHRGYDRY